MSQSFPFFERMWQRFERATRDARRATREPRHFTRTRNAGRTLERVQFLCSRVSHQVAVFHAMNVGPQGRDYKR
jgi:hypothetical protein